MRGEVLEFTATGGVIVDGYGARYTFESTVTQTPLSVGDAVRCGPEQGVGARHVGGCACPTLAVKSYRPSAAHLTRPSASH